MLLLETVSYWSAFTAGVMAFFSPCVMPLIPAWLTLLTGLRYDEISEAKSGRLSKIFLPTILFVLGFSFIFCLLGAGAGLIGESAQNIMQQHIYMIRYAGGAFLIFFGLYLLGIISPAWLMRERRADLRKRPLGLAGSFIVGMAFAAGWTPCVGPILAVILGLAAMEQSAWSGLKLLATFSLGLGLPFLVLSLLWGHAISVLSRIKKYTVYSNKILGILVLILAILLISGNLSWGS